MEHYLRMLIDALIEPVGLFRRLRMQPLPLFALIVAGVSQLALTPLNAETVRFQGQFQGQFEVPAGVVSIGSGIGQLLIFFVLVLCIHAAARILGGTGSLSGVISGLGMAMTPALLAAPIYVLSAVTGLSALSMLSVPLLTLWSFVLDVLAVREVHQLTTGRAFFSILMAVFILLLVGLGIGLLASFFFLLSAPLF